MKKVATDTFSFEGLRIGGGAYIDKTAILKVLAGKSLGKKFSIMFPLPPFGLYA